MVAKKSRNPSLTETLMHKFPFRVGCQGGREYIRHPSTYIRPLVIPILEFHSLGLCISCPLPTTGVTAGVLPVICMAGSSLSTLTLGKRGTPSPFAATGLVYGGASSYSGGWPIGGSDSLFEFCGLALGVRIAGSLALLSVEEV